MQDKKKLLHVYSVIPTPSLYRPGGTRDAVIFHFRNSDIFKMISTGSVAASLAATENLENSRSLLCCELLNRSFELKMLLVSISCAYTIITAAKLIRHFLNCEGRTVQALLVFRCLKSQAFGTRAGWNLVFLFPMICLCGQQRSCGI